MASSTDLTEYLSTWVTPQRKELIEKILNQRTRYLTVVLEDIFQSQNASAVIRSCECFGIQDVHIIENRFKHDLNHDVVMGANKWMNIQKYSEQENNTSNAIQKLRSEGYRIIATTPLQNAVPAKDFDVETGKFAIFIGTERKGLSKQVLEKADEAIYIPMCGFTESLNLSVSAAILLYELATKLRNTNIDWHLNDDDKASLRELWLTTRIKKSNLIVEHFHKNVLKSE